MILKRFRPHNQFSWYFIVLAFFLVNFVAFIFFSNEKEDQIDRVSHQSLQKKQQLFAEFHRVVENDLQIMETFLKILMNNQDMVQALKSGDRQALYATTSPIYQSLFKRYNISHFDFLDVNGYTFLKMHKPYDYGDIDEHIDFSPVGKAGLIHKGIELGNYEIMGARLLLPWKHNNQLIGYIDVAVPITTVVSQLYDFWQKIHREPIDIALFVDKNNLNEEKWREGNQFFNKKNDWEKWRSWIVSVMTSQISDTQLNVFSSMHMISNEFHFTQVDERFQHFILYPIADLHHQHIGDIGIIFDVDAAIKEINRDFYWNLGFFLLLSSSFILFREILFAHQQRQVKRLNFSLEKQVKVRTHQLFLKKENLKQLLEEQKRNNVLKNLLNKALEIMLTAESKQSLFSQIVSLIEKDCEKVCRVAIYDNRGNEIIHGDDNLPIAPIEYNEHLAEHHHIPIYLEDKHTATIVLKSGEVTWMDVTEIDFFNALAKVISLGLNRLDYAQRLKQTNFDLEGQVKLRTKALEKSMQEAERANQTKSIFMANMSHEIRTPMHAVISFSAYGMSRINKVSSEKLYAYFERIHSSGERLLKLLDDILDISKYEASKMELTYNLDRLSKIAKKCVIEQESMLQKKHLQVSWNVIAQVDRGEFDRDRMMQVISNLLSNAIKFSPQQGTIHFQFSSAMLDIEGNSVSAIEMQISDEGPGVVAEELEAIFDKFVQSKKIRAGIGGTGLGLAICKEIIGLHHGKIWAQPERAIGAGFVVLIPKKKPEVENNE